MGLTLAQRNARTEHAEFCRSILAKHLRGGMNLYFMRVHTSPAPAYNKHYRILIAAHDQEGNHVIKDMTSTVCGLFHERMDANRGTFITTDEPQEIASAVGRGLGLGDNAFDVRSI